MVVDPLLRYPSVARLGSTLGMPPQSVPAKDMVNITENNIVIRVIHDSAVTHVDVIGHSLVTRPGVTS